jgi:glycosyltransferase involved in cell wall biosynthesis
MHLKNREGVEKYFIKKDWLENRKDGISAMIRIKNEEEFILPSIQSVLGFFDEIIVTLNGSEDNTENIIRNINSDKIKIYQYPFKMHHNGPGHRDIPEDSIHDLAYYYNWSLSLTSRSFVCKWDGDMIATPNMVADLSNYKKFGKTFFHGINLSGDHISHFSPDLVATFEPRVFKVCPESYYIQGDFCEVLNNYSSSESKIDKRCYLHFKNCKRIETATQVWPDNWMDVPHFKRLNERRKVYNEVYPEPLKNKIIRDAIGEAKKVEDLKSQKQVMGDMADIFFSLKKKDIVGDMCEIGVKAGKTTVFISNMMMSLFPNWELYSCDPLNDKFASGGLNTDGANNIGKFREKFCEHISKLSNHKHFFIPSCELKKEIEGRKFNFVYIDGEHSEAAVNSDFGMMFPYVVKGGVIAIDDYKNQAWPGVTKAYRSILDKYKGKISIIISDDKTSFLEKLV